MNQIMQGQPMTIFGDGEQTRAFSHIDDVAPHIASCVSIPAAYGQVVNIGADEPYSVNRLAGVVAKSFGVDPKIEHLAARNEVVHAYSDHSKARRLFGDKPAVTLEDGIGRMAQWARRVGARESKPFRDIEIRKNLPPRWA